MARARNIKPGVFKNEILLEMEPVVRLLFIGLWTLADREGRIEDRPKRIKLELLPFDDVNVDEMLDQLADGGFINRYEANGVKVIEVCNFLKHQNPHGTEKDSELPDLHGNLTLHERGKNGCVTGNKRAVNVKNNKNNVKPTLDNSESTVNSPLDNALIPESLILNPDSLNPDYGILKPEKKQEQQSRGTRLPADWKANDEELEFCRTTRPDLNCFTVEATFRDYWIAQAGQKGIKKDWSATWRNWVRNEKQVYPPRGQAKSQPGTSALFEQNMRNAQLAKELIFGKQTEVIDHE